VKILIAQPQNDCIDNSLSQYLERDGHTCVNVQQSASVLDEIYRETPDIAVLCTQLKQPTCHTILKKIKAAPSTRNIPVFYLAPINARSHLLRGYESGMYDYISMPWFPEEVSARLRNIEQVCDKLRELEENLVRDYLTGIYNRKFFMERFEEESSWARRYDEPISVVMIDIDFFKKINDTYGHSTGDHVLQRLSGIVSACLRPGDIFARFGGEEFIVLLPNTDAFTACGVGEALRLAVAESEFISDDDLKLSVTISSGIATFHGALECATDNILGRADAALYRAKANGRNVVVLAD
jgi:diguanylate cyclase (GGDEF)-like protein